MFVNLHFGSKQNSQRVRFYTDFPALLRLSTEKCKLKAKLAEAGRAYGKQNCHLKELNY